MIQKKINIQNKKARFEFDLIDQYTAGMVLTGTEIKSIRESKASITESFCEFNERGELFAVNMYIEEYLYGTITTTNRVRRENYYSIKGSCENSIKKLRMLV